MKVAIRADAAASMGSGHVMRCLCLADSLQVRGAEVVFVSRKLPSHLAAAITAHGHALRELTLPPLDEEQAPQECWPAARQREDARATLDSLAGFGADWLVADHYGLGIEWESTARPAARRLMAIDDLARTHDCNLLLDPNLHADPAPRYEGRVPSSARLLLGPSFALLRKEFLRERAKVEVRRGQVRRMLVFMGGMDSGNATAAVLEALSRAAPTMPVDVVIGATHPARAGIEDFCARSTAAVCHVQTPDMATLLARCDLAVGAGGGASWERCCLGVPTLALALAENQHALLGPAARAGLVYAPDCPPGDVERLESHLRALIDNGALRESISAAGMAVVDGRGAQRVAGAMAAGLITMRRAEPDDSARILAWRNAPKVRAMSLDDGEIPAAVHDQWFARILTSSKHALLVGEDDEGAAGVVRFDFEDDSAATVSIYLAEARNGQGLGPGLLRAAEEWLLASHPGILVIHAQVMAANKASRRLFEQCGYQPGSQHFSRRVRA